MVETLEPDPSGAPRSGTPAPRRTQAERRHTTITAILDATIASIAENGYAKTTVAEIAHRAGVSQGALFRHFRTRLDIITAAAEDVGARQVRHFLELLASTEQRDPTGAPSIGITEVLTVMRQIARAPHSAVWDELIVHARADAELRERIAPLFRRYLQELSDTADALPMLAGRSPAERRALLTIVVSLFGGEARSSHLRSDPQGDTETLRMLVQLAHSLGIP